jgi:hypothetical protein
MSYRGSTGALALAAALMVTMGGVGAAEDAKYPDWKGQWAQILTPGLEGQMVKFDPTKPWGRGQQAPLTPEYRKVHEDSMADQANGGLGNYPTARCLPGGMPRMMTAAQEYVITPETTYILIGTVLVDPSADRIALIARLDVCWPVAPVGEDPTNVVLAAAGPAHHHREQDRGRRQHRRRLCLSRRT